MVQDDITKLSSFDDEFQDFLNADEIKHLQKKAAILNLSNDIIVNKNFLHKEKKENGVVEKMGKL